MKPSPFDYVAATSIEDAVLLLDSGPDARILAGGQSLMPLLNLRLAVPELVVDIGRVPELREIRIEGDELVIGSGVTQAETAADERVRSGWPLLAEAIGHIGHPQIRNRGTVCGSLAHNDPLAELPAVAVALGARVVTRSRSGERVIEAADLFTGPFTTALEPDELIVAVRIPAPTARPGWSFREFATRPGDFATAGVISHLAVTENIITDAMVVLFGVASSPVRAEPIEAALAGATSPVLDATARERFAASLDPPDDAHASGASRTQLVTDLLSESLAEAWERAR